MAGNVRGFNDSFSPPITAAVARVVEWYPHVSATPIRVQPGTTWNVFVASWAPIINNTT